MINFGSDFIDSTASSLAKVVEHIEYIRNVTGSADHLGLGADFDGTDKP